MNKQNSIDLEKLSKGRNDKPIAGEAWKEWKSKVLKCAAKNIKNKIN